MSKRFASLLAFSALVGCGASVPTASPKSSESAAQEPTVAPELAHAPEGVAAEATTPHDEAREEAPVALEIPTECAAPGAKVCTPPTSFVDQLCQSKSADVALAMFRKSMPWTRAYLRRDTDAWYMGARRSSPVKLVIDEEVIVVAHRNGGSGGIQVSGSDSYDVYRWDGKCVSVMADEVSLRRPTAPRSAPIAWKALNEATHAALLDDRGIKSRYDHLQHGRCNDDSSSPRCTEETAALIRLIADYVRRGGKLPDARLTSR